MYHQFKELADVDITKNAMEVGPTLHYIMGGIRVDADTAAATVPGLYAAGEVAAGMHGANRLGGNSLSDLLVFGKRAGHAAAEYSKRTPAPHADDAQLSAYAQRFGAPFERPSGENPYAIQAELQETMQDLVGIIRRREELEEALTRLERLRARAARAGATGSRVYNPGWHLALDLENLIAVSEAVARSALLREESRGGHTREDFPKTDPVWGTKNVVTRRRDGRLVLATEPIPPVPGELRALIGEDKPSDVAATAAKAPVAAGDD
jgi:succinate dehydrogenase / fumarate reductase flavoprotein subunit